MMTENIVPKWYREGQYLMRNPRGLGKFIIFLNPYCYDSEVDELINDANRAAQLEAVSAKLAEAVGALLPLLEDVERYSEVIAAGDALSEYQKLQTKGASDD